MDAYLKTFIAVAALVVISGCGTTQVKEDTKSVGLLIKSVGNTGETFQKQRDVIAVADLRNRQALERLAMEYEARTTADVAVWELSGQTERKRIFEGLKQSAEKLQAQRDEHEKRAQERARELANARSAVNFQATKLTEASTTLVKLGEPRPAREEIEFLIGFLQSVRDDISKKEEEAAKKISGQAAATLKAKGDQ